MNKLGWMDQNMDIFLVWIHWRLYLYNALISSAYVGSCYCCIYNNRYKICDEYDTTSDQSSVIFGTFFQFLEVKQKYIFLEKTLIESRGRASKDTLIIRSFRMIFDKSLQWIRNTLYQIFAETKTIVRQILLH